MSGLQRGQRAEQRDERNEESELIYQRVTLHFQ